MQNPKIAVCIFRRFHFAKSEDSSLHFPDLFSARCRQANARNILDQLHAQKTPVGTRRKSGVAKTGSLVPAEPVFRSQLARSAIWYPYFSQIRKFGIRCSEKPQVRKFASRYSGYQTSCFARRWVPSRQSWRAWVPQPPNFVGNFSTRDTKPRSFVTHHAQGVWHFCASGCGVFRN